MKVLDLTMRISPKIKVFPGSPQPSFVPWSRMDVQGYDSEVMTMSTHTGTHVDAPSHFALGRSSIGDIPASRLVCDAVLVKAPKDAGQEITVADIKHEDISPGDAVLLATGWEKKRYRSKNYMTENPGLSRAAARYLVDKKAGMACIDGPSIDPGSDVRFSSHNILLPAGVLVAENLCNVDRIRKKRFTLVVAPLRLAGATGSPARVLALL